MRSKGSGCPRRFQIPNAGGYLTLPRMPSRAPHEFPGHAKGVFEAGVFERECLRAGKTKAWIVVGMPDNYDDLLTPLAQQIQAMMNQSSTDPPALMLG